jgi:hypothetical protein
MLLESTFPKIYHVTAQQEIHNLLKTFWNINHILSYLPVVKGKCLHQHVYKNIKKHSVMTTIPIGIPVQLILTKLKFCNRYIALIITENLCMYQVQVVADEKLFSNTLLHGCLSTCKNTRTLKISDIYVHCNKVLRNMHLDDRIQLLQQLKLQSKDLSLLTITIAEYHKCAFIASLCRTTSNIKQIYFTESTHTINHRHVNQNIHIWKRQHSIIVLLRGLDKKFYCLYNKTQYLDINKIEHSITFELSSSIHTQANDIHILELSIIKKNNNVYSLHFYRWRNDLIFPQNEDYIKNVIYCLKYPVSLNHIVEQLNVSSTV